MKWFKTPELVTSLLAWRVLTGLHAPATQADFVFGAPTNLGNAINTSAKEFGAYLSPDGLELYFARGDVRADIWVARRATPDSRPSASGRR